MPVPKSAAPSKRVLMRDAVFERLLDLIVSGQLAPAEVLNDADLEEWAGASRTPVREALNRLADMGLVRIAPQAKTRVAALDSKEFLDAVELQSVLTQELIKEVWPLLTPADKSQLVEISERTAELSPDHYEVQVGRDIMKVLMARYGNDSVARLIAKYSPLITRVIVAHQGDVDAQRLNTSVRSFAIAAASGNVKAVLKTHLALVENFGAAFTSALAASRKPGR